MTTEYRIYVASLAAYNAGILHGAWIQADQDADGINADIQEMLDACPEKGEEWAIHDYEMGGIKLGESEDIETVSDLAQALTDHHGDAFAAFWNNDSYDDVDTAVEAFEEAYIGEYESLTDYAESYLDDTGALNEVPEWLRPYIDAEAIGRDMELGGDIWTHPTKTYGVYIFRNV